MPSDEELVELALRGNDAAFGTLVDRYQERLLRFLLLRCRNRADAEDALQDALLDAWRYLASFNARWRFSTWLYRIAIRRAVRNRERTQQTGIDDLPGTDDPLADCVAESERTNLWLTARRVLTPDAATALWLHYVEELPLRDVARALQRSLPWTKVSLMRARRRLQRELADERGNVSRSEAYG